MRIAFTTLGCKINQSETEAMRQTAAAAGNAVVPFESEADVYVINTCSVTAKSDYQCRQTIRAAVRRADGARVIVTGCYAETRPDELRKMPGVALVLGNGEKTNIGRYLAGHRDDAAAMATQSFATASGRTRRFLKVQDGCDSRCAYCVVPFARGGSKSVPRSEVIAQFDGAVSEGCPEVVLSGIHIGRYGTDLVPQDDLAGLVRELLARRQHTRIRLSSIEPKELTEGILSMVGHGLCRHLHIPLQSGDDAILCSMNRHYSSSDYVRLLTTITAKDPDIAVGADVMVGFPGEGERAFMNTYELIDSLPLSHLHVFSYSSRPGTAAALMKEQVPDRVKRQRNEKLRALALEKNIAFRRKMVGKVVSVVLEEADRDGQPPSGLTDNYIRVHVHGANRDHLGREIMVLMTGIDEKGLKGEISLVL